MNASPHKGAPRSPTVTDRRRIFDALEVAYNVEAGRYRADGSDAALAKRLDVPRGWITHTRELFFGTLDRNEVAIARAAEDDRLDEIAARVEAIFDELAALSVEVAVLKRKRGANPLDSGGTGR